MTRPLFFDDAQDAGKGELMAERNSAPSFAPRNVAMRVTLSLLKSAEMEVPIAYKLTAFHFLLFNTSSI